MSATADLAARFQKLYGVDPRIARAPGRVNLIGEHTDYNDGFVLPIAIELSTLVAFARRTGESIVVRSENFDEEVSLDLEARAERARLHWSDYARAVALMLREAGISLPGATLLVASDVPLGAGLSSSASFEVATALALLSLAGRELPAAEIALLCQRAESEVVGARCGIMDQFISCLGQEDHAMLLDCRSQETRFVRLPQDVRIVVVDSGVRHALADGDYNRRRSECELAAQLLALDRARVRALRDVTQADVERLREELGVVLFRRARHVVSENARVLAAVDALERGASEELGVLMRQSHESLRDDFAVSCAELDALVEIARSEPGVLGSRMTGGGFGGSTVHLVRESSVERFCASIVAGYAAAIGKNAEVYVTRAVRGAG